MLTATSVLEQEYFLEFPAVIRERMNIKAGDRFYAYKKDTLTLIVSRLHPGKSKYCSCVYFIEEHGAVLPYGFLHRMRIRSGDTLELTMESQDEVTIRQKSDVIQLFSPKSQRVVLRAKLKREFEAPSRFSHQSFREDLYSVLSLTEWDDDVVLRLIQTPNLLRELTWALYNDDAFLDFFEQRAKALTLELIKNQR